MGMDAATDRAARIVTIPNVISLVRLACAPVFVWLLAEDDLLAAAALLAVLGASDWVDGWIARRFDQGSNLGKVLDPVADRILLLLAAVALVVQGSVPLVVGILVLVREAVVSVAVLALAAAGARRIDVQWVGKAGTLALMFAFPLYLWADAISGTASDVVLTAAWFMAVCGLVFSYYAALTYVPLARAALRDGRASHTAGSIS
ncbi:MAG TPA: CDP-alcohol phosphatidyltransferase family protein [Acidimicrobiia bacterium]|jgi:cardiolipin synthase|nr:CDP-alcohol phosphatidyltransferase family protein [Acidimicrobiia bacterium]